MTCEKCGAELIRGSLICRGCHHSNGPRTGSGRLSSGIEQPTGARLTRRGGVEGNLIQFPAGVGEEESSASAPTGADWKVEIRERVRESRERRGVVGQSVANREEAAAEKRNPIVNNAKCAGWSSNCGTGAAAGGGIEVDDGDTASGRSTA
jgi:hypothetical protein